MTNEQLHKMLLKAYELLEQHATRIEDLEMQVFPNLAGNILQERCRKIVAMSDVKSDLVGG